MKVLLLHGVGGGAAIWGPEGSGTVAALRSAGHEAIAVDLPGYGVAPGPAGMEAFVGAVCEAAGATPVTLIGHSMGGMVAQEVLARKAARVCALVLACTSAAFGRADGTWQAQFLADRLAPLDRGLGMAAVAAQLVPGLVAPEASDAVRAAAAAVMARVPEATYRQALQAIVGFDRRDALERIGVPTLLIAAGHDRTASPEVMKRMAQKIPGSRYRCLDRAGHIANVEQPAAFNAVLLEFLSQLQE